MTEQHRSDVPLRAFPPLPVLPSTQEAGDEPHQQRKFDSETKREEHRLRPFSYKPDAHDESPGR